MEHAASASVVTATAANITTEKRSILLRQLMQVAETRGAHAAAGRKRRREDMSATAAAEDAPALTTADEPEEPRAKQQRLPQNSDSHMAT